MLDRMAVKGKRRYRKTSRKSSLRHGSRARTRSKSHTRRRRCMRGGNYEKDVTEQVFQGFPMKASNKVVTTVPGYGTMSVSAYKQLQSDLDRNGKHYYD